MRTFTVLAKKVFTFTTATAVLVASLTTLTAAPAPAAAETTEPSSSSVAEISTGSRAPSNLQTAVDPTGHVTAIWQIHNGSREVIQASTSQNGGEWSAVVTISNLTDANTIPALVVNDRGSPLLSGEARAQTAPRV